MVGMIVRFRRQPSECLLVEQRGDSDSEYRMWAAEELLREGSVGRCSVAPARATEYDVVARLCIMLLVACGKLIQSVINSRRWTAVCCQTRIRKQCSYRTPRSGQ